MNFRIKLKRDGKILWEKDLCNHITAEAFTRMANDMLAGAQRSNTKSIALRPIDATSFTSVAFTDTYSSHPGWILFGGSAIYSPHNAGSGTLDSYDWSELSVTADGKIRGMAVIVSQAFNPTYLWSTIDFEEDVSVKNGDTFYIKYAITASGVV